MNKMVRNLAKVATICAASVLVLASCSKHDINASRQQQLEERYKVASAEIENSAPRSGAVVKSTEEEVVAQGSAEVNAPATTAPAATQPESVNSTTTVKTAKKGFIERTAEKMVIKKVERYVSKHPNLQKKYEGVQGIDQNLKMAIIFAIVAVILGIIAGIAGPASWIFWIASVVFWIIALYFLIMWVLTL